MGPNAVSRGQFIVLEGLEGAGKTTNLTYLKTLIEEHGATLDVTREPGGTHFSEQLRNLLLHYSEEKIEPLTELLLMFAARQQHMQQRILPQLRQGNWVLCDRFLDATYAYQGAGRGISSTHISALESLVLSGFKPDWVVILDVPYEISLERVQRRVTSGNETDRFEQEREAFFSRVRAAYLARAQQSSLYSVIDASQPLNAVQMDIRHHFFERFSMRTEGDAEARSE